MIFLDVVYNITRSTVVMTGPGSKDVGENTVAHDNEHRLLDKVGSHYLY